MKVNFMRINLPPHVFSYEVGVFYHPFMWNNIQKNEASLFLFVKK